MQPHQRHTTRRPSLTATGSKTNPSITPRPKHRIRYRPLRPAGGSPHAARDTPKGQSWSPPGRLDCCAGWARRASEVGACRVREHPQPAMGQGPVACHPATRLDGEQAVAVGRRHWRPRPISPGIWLDRSATGQLGRVSNRTSPGRRPDCCQTSHPRRRA
jgi:hypothetical protein